MSSIFSKIIAGEIRSYKIAEDERFFAFLDIFPLAKGHVLVVPKIEVDYIFELDDNTLGDMMIFSKRVAKAIDQVIECERVGVAVIGLEVPHAHIHLVPLNSVNDINFTQPKLALPKEELADIAQKISSAFI
jgi:histidine triad (HIT) family protein